jgi:hypothetical protein
MKTARLNHINVVTPSTLPFKGRWPLKGGGGVSRFPEGTPTCETSSERVTPSVRLRLPPPLEGEDFRCIPSFQTL